MIAASAILLLVLVLIACAAMLIHTIYVTTKRRWPDTAIYVLAMSVCVACGAVAISEYVNCIREAL